MSRIANTPISVVQGVDIDLSTDAIKVSGKKGKLHLSISPDVKVSLNDNALSVAVLKKSKQAVTMAGTTRALINNMVEGVSKGFEKKLTLIGVGYRAKVEGKNIKLTLGFSHPVVYKNSRGCGCIDSYSDRNSINLLRQTIVGSSGSRNTCL